MFFCSVNLYNNPVWLVVLSPCLGKGTRHRQVRLICYHHEVWLELPTTRLTVELRSVTTSPTITTSPTVLRLRRGTQRQQWAQRKHIEQKLGPVGPLRPLRRDDVGRVCRSQPGEAERESSPCEFMVAWNCELHSGSRTQCM